MNRETTVQTISMEIDQTREKLLELAERKRDGEGPKTSWHDTTHLDTERAIADYERYLAKCLKVLASVQGYKPSMVISDGSLVKLSIDEEETDYVIVERENGGLIGNIPVLSSQSLIGKSIWNKTQNEQVTVQTPNGSIKVKILKIS